ncbi:MAG: Tetratricopeptide 2 repeat protein [Pedosphaera sp.]|nr:Tetratricopeptide 2 repeat protein [Pedosphaera sp.]
MDKAVDQSVDLFNLVTWFHANRKRVVTILVAVLVVAAAVGIYIWHQNYTETQANAALSEIKPPMPSQEGALPNPADAQPYERVAEEHPGTSAGARALLMSGGILFDAGKFDEAKAQFDKFLSAYPDNLLAVQAQLGVAASLEAAGKLPEATAHYDELIKRHPNESIIPQAQSALARLYVAQNKPELAVHLYEGLAKANNNDSWSAEAGIQLQELLAKYPNLRKPVAPPPAPKTSATVTVPPLH